MRLMDILIAFPGIFLALAIIAALGTRLLNVVLAAGISLVPQFARVVRGSVLGLRKMEFVQAARALGHGGVAIVFRYLLPNSLAPLIVQTILRMATVLLTASGLSFLGLGVQPPSPDWGAILPNARSYMITALLETPDARDREAARSIPASRHCQAGLHTRPSQTRAYQPRQLEHDLHYLDRPNARRVQLDYFYDYRTNAELYPQWQAFLRKQQPKTIIFWGQDDIFFTREGGESYLKDLPHAEMHRLDSGHFAVEDCLDEIASQIRRFYDEQVAVRTT